MNDILDSIIHASDSDDLRWCGESPVLVEIAATDATLITNQEFLHDFVYWS